MKVIAIERGYYGGKIQEPLDNGGEPFFLTNEKHLGKWMQPQGWKPSGALPLAESASQDGGAGGGAGQQSAGGAPAAFTVKHNGGGRWIVIDTEGEKVGDFVGGKDDAQAEADRLIAGGAPFVKPAEPAVDAGAATTNTTGQDGGAGGGADPTMPDA